jgi:sugar transferase (PEP-CTERM/EpsH1 system associated)
VRAYHLLESFRAWANVDLVSLAHDRDEEAKVSELRDLATTVTVARAPKVRNWLIAAATLPTATPLTHVLLDAPSIESAVARIVRNHEPDVVIAYCSGMSRLALHPPLERYPYVLDMVDVDSLKWRSLAASAPRPQRWIFAREARLLQRFEVIAASRAAATVVVNERERESLAAIATGAHIAVVSNGVDLERLRPPDPPISEPRIVFCGVLNYRPNEEAIVWFTEQIWPIIRAHRSDAQLLIVGSAPSSVVRSFAAKDRSIEVTGTVPDVRPYLWNSAVSIAPLHVARGVQNKVLEAVAAGLPSVVTPAVAEGLPAEILAACRVASTPDLFAEEVLALLRLRPEGRRALTQKTPLDGLGWRHRLSDFRSIVEEAAARGRLRGSQRMRA